MSKFGKHKLSLEIDLIYPLSPKLVEEDRVVYESNIRRDTSTMLIGRLCMHLRMLGVTEKELRLALVDKLETSIQRDDTPRG